VIFAGDLGIYGQCIVIDHGIGLQTLYGHLNQIAVKVGDSNEKGQNIGNTGSTGMVFGDHLHFGVVVGGQEVSPVEWWDASWLKNNITGKLELGKNGAPR
jgi:murein DD-endopeptidase MepM/ murein hydrolase activator NlpD